MPKVTPSYAKGYPISPCKSEGMLKGSSNSFKRAGTVNAKGYANHFIARWT